MKKVWICRGLPGSGKSTLARMLRGQSFLVGKLPAEILSSDDYFTIAGVYYFDATQLFKAHSWNQWRFAQLAAVGLSAIIDNTNTTWKEVEPYAKIAVDNGYQIEVVQPDTPWAFDIAGLIEHGTHGVPRETYEKMLARFEDVESIREKVAKL